MAMLNVLASHFGMESTGYGRTLRSKDEIFRIVAITPNRSKCPINAERVNDGRGFNCPTGNVAMRLSSVHALRKYTLCSSKSPNMQLRAPYPVQDGLNHSEYSWESRGLGGFEAVSHRHRKSSIQCSRNSLSAHRVWPAYRQHGFRRQPFRRKCKY